MLPALLTCPSLACRDPRLWLRAGTLPWVVALPQCQLHPVDLVDEHSADLLWVSLQGLSFWVFYSDRCEGSSLGFRDTVVDKPYQGWHSKVVRKKIVVYVMYM